MEAHRRLFTIIPEISSVVSWDAGRALSAAALLGALDPYYGVHSQLGAIANVGA